MELFVKALLLLAPPQARKNIWTEPLGSFLTRTSRVGEAAITQTSADRHDNT
jgi:hypothetical protein